MTADLLIKKLNLTRHPEGGFYRETYRSKQSIILDNGKTRNTATAIYYLLKDTDKSFFHKIGSDEIWLFHQGGPVEISMITKEGSLATKILGNQIDLFEEPQLVIPADVWFAAQLKNKIGYAPVSCIVAPGFDFDDFELGDKTELINAFPNIKTDIEKLSINR